MKKIISLCTVERAILMMMCVFIYIFNYQTDGMGSSITNAIIICFIALEIIFIIKKNNFQKNQEIISLAGFVIICFFSCLYSYNFKDSLIKVKTLVILFLLVLCIFNFLKRDKKNIIFFLKSIAISGVLSSIYLITMSDWKSGVRIDNILGDSNQVAAYIAYSFTVLLYLMKTKNVSSTYGIIGMMLMFVANVLSGSRSALIVTFLAGIVYLLMGMKREKNKFLKILVIAIIAVVILYGVYYLIMNNEVLYNIIGRRYVSFFEIMNGKSSSINETSTQTRTYLIELAWKKFTNNFFTIIFGNGIGFFASYWVSVGGRYAFCHNNYLELLSGVGIIGTICFYYVYLKTLFFNIHKYREDKSQSSILCITLLIEILLMHWFVVFYYQKCEMLFLAIFIYFNSLKNKGEKNEFKTETY